MNHIRYSVVIPAYNAQKYILNALEAVKNQTYKNYEVLITNNGSTDKTLDLVTTYIRENPQIKIKVFTQENRGISGSRNTGIYAASGDYICFLDADDWWNSNKLYEINKVLEKNEKIDVIYHNQLMRTSTSSKKIVCRKLKRPVYEDLLFNGNTLLTSATVVRAAVVKEIGGFRMELVSGEEDYDLWLRLAKKGCEFYWVNKTLGEYRCYGDNFSANFVKHSLARIKLIKNYYNQYIKEKNVHKSYVIKRFRYRKAKELCYLGRRYSKIEDRNKAKFYYKKALKVNPFYYKTYAGIILNILKI